MSEHLRVAVCATCGFSVSDSEEVCPRHGIEAQRPATAEEAAEHWMAFADAYRDDIEQLTAELEKQEVEQESLRRRLHWAQTMGEKHRRGERAQAALARRYEAALREAPMPPRESVLDAETWEGVYDDWWQERASEAAILQARRETHEALALEDEERRRRLEEILSRAPDLPPEEGEGPEKGGEDDRP